MAAIARSLGLPAAAAVSPELSRRGYITVVRRNWHLLPYDQLLVLLDMTADQLAFSLREDDVLFHKLGALKPKCEPLHYHPPTAAEQARAAEIAGLVERHFGAALAGPAEPRFDFVRQLNDLDGIPPPAPAAAGGNRQLRYIYSYFGSFGDPLADAKLDPYPDGLLARLANVGVTGVWLHVVLRQLAPGGQQFPEFGAGHEQRLENLRHMVARAKRYGIGIYLYMNEPRAMPANFFAERSDMAGVREGDYLTMCTSDERVRRWLSDSLAHIFREVPDLAGVFTITASENLTNCASHGQKEACPRCSKRSEAEIISEVVATIAAGVHRSQPGARVIAWDWGWYGNGDATETIARLTPEVSLQSVSEWSLPIERGGVKSTVGEYSISAVGPGPRATRHWAAARRAGIKTLAKVQLNNTWELSAVPYLPVLDLVAQHCENLARAEVDGLMLSWSLGGYPSPNLRVAQRFAEQPTAKKDEVLDRIALERYGPAGAPHARKAWTALSNAFTQFPYSGSGLYNGPQQVGPANLLFGEPTGYSSTMVGYPYDDLGRWCGFYPPDVYAGQYAKIAAGWAEGLEHLEQAVALAPESRRAEAQSDLRVAQAAQLHFASVANQARFVIARDARRAADASAQQRVALRDEMVRLLDDEIAVARKLFDLVQKDSRIGFEASNHYYYLPNDLVEKMINCEYLRSQLVNAQ